MILSRCPFCEAVFEQREAHIVGETPRQQLVHLQCRFCAHAVLTLINLSPKGFFSIGMLTDCSREDSVRFALSPIVIGENDVLQTHLSLQDDAAFLRALRGA